MAITKVNHPDLLDLHSDTGATVFPKGTTAERPVSPEAGYIRFNTTDNVMETYDGTGWKVLDTVASAYDVDYLVVAGGGGGGYNSPNNGGGGGGAGGYIYNTSYTLTPSTSYTITIGAGGGNNSSGQNSVFNTFTSIGGGGGGGDTNSAPLVGGSGGGGTYNFNQLTFSNPYRYDGAAGTVGQGYKGGYFQSDLQSYIAGGGGGGAGQEGGNASGFAPENAFGGNGGNGLASSITGTSVIRAGGGGGGAGAGSNPNGGTGGTGGGGAGGTSSIAGQNGTANTGSGGGSGYITGNGGSGVVILRMPTANYSGTTTGSPTVTTDGSDTILTYTSSGTYTA